MSFGPFGQQPEKDELTQIQERIASEDKAVRADALEDMAIYLTENDKEDEIEPYILAAIDIYEGLGREVELISLYDRLGDFQRNHKRIDNAVDSYLEAVSISRRSFNEAEGIAPMMDLAEVYVLRDEWATALHWFGQAYEIAAESSNESRAGWVMYRTSRALQELGDFIAASDAAGKAAAHYTEAEVFPAVADMLNNQAWCGLFEETLTAQVTDLLARSAAVGATVFQPMADEFRRLISILYDCKVGVANGETRKQIDEMLKVTRERNDARAANATYYALASYELATGNPLEAISLVKQFILADDLLETRIARRFSLELLFNAQLEAKRHAEARETAMQLIEITKNDRAGSLHQRMVDQVMQIDEQYGGFPIPNLDADGNILGCFLAAPASPTATDTSSTLQTSTDQKAHMLTAITGDITQVSADAIVNAAKISLAGGGGVDGAIHRAAGPALAAAAIPLGPCPTGDARITPGFNLPAKYVIHTVGPVWSDGLHGEPQLLAACYYNALAAAVEVGARTVVFPGISTGIYGYPVEDATRVAVAAITEFIADQPDAFDAVQLIWLTQAETAAAAAIIAAA